MNYRNIGKILPVFFIINSILNICIGSVLFKTHEVYQNSIANDLINIIYGLIAFIVFFNTNRKLKIVSLGFYLIFSYSFIANAFMIGNVISIIANLVLAASAIVFFLLNLLSISHGVIIKKINGGVLASIVLMLLGIVFISKSLNLVITIADDSNRIVEFGTSIADLVICSIWIAFSILFLIKTRIGIFGIYPILMQASMLFISLVLYLFLNSLINNKAIPYIDILVVGVMSLLVIIPFIIIIKNNNLTTASS